MGGTHARLSPSNHRWPHCPGSVREEAAYEDVAGEAAIDGTGSHELLELCVNSNTSADFYVGEVVGEDHPDKPSGWKVTESRAERVDMCLDYVDRRIKELREKYPEEKGFEIRVSAESKSDPGGMFGRDDWYGTADITIEVVDDRGRCVYVEIIDYKDGRGWVTVEDNSQLLAYLGGKLRPHVASGPDLVRPFKTGHIDGCRMTIVQPKTSRPIRYQDITAAAAIDKVAALGFAASRTDAPDAPLKAGDHCKWCKHGRAGNCPAKAEESMAMVSEVTTDGGLVESMAGLIANIKEVDSSQLAKLADAEGGITDMFDKVRLEILRRIEEGQHVEGWEISPGRGKKVWNEDDDTIAKKLAGRKLTKPEIFPAKLITPAAALKLEKLTDSQKKRISDELISVVEGKPALRKSRRAAKPTVDQMFSDVPEQLELVDDIPVSFL